MSLDFARDLRRNMTDVERRLWGLLRDKRLANHKFRRQQPIGPYIADFVCFEARLIVELDGEQHAAQRERDEVRTAWLNSQGFEVVRFWNHLVFEETEGVLDSIVRTLEARSQGDKR